MYLTYILVFSGLLSPGYTPYQFHTGAWTREAKENPKKLVLCFIGNEPVLGENKIHQLLHRKHLLSYFTIDFLFGCCVLTPSFYLPVFGSRVRFYAQKEKKCKGSENQLRGHSSPNINPMWGGIHTHSQHGH